MARQIKWRLQFRSLNGTGCLVNIWEEGYTGSSADTTKTGANVPFTVESGVSSLTGAAVPFEYQDDDSTDLLNFIRVKTGYIRVIETYYGELDALQPTSLQHHFVEAFYGSERVFTGYMQCAEYSNGWEACPRELEYPIVSPLGLLSAKKFSVPASTSTDVWPKTTNVGSFMYEVLCAIAPLADGTSSEYTHVQYPQFGGNQNYITFPWNGLISTTVLVPYNSAYKHYEDEGNLWEPKDMQYFVEGICANFGWLVYDTPTSIVFSKFDKPANGTNTRLPIANLLTGSMTGESTFGGQRRIYDNYDPVDDEATISVVRPLKKLEVNFDGDTPNTKSMTVAHTKTASTRPWATVQGSNYRAYKLTPIGNNQTGPRPDVFCTGSGMYGNTPDYSTNATLTNAGLFPIALGKIDSGAKSLSISEYWGIHKTSDYGTNANLITVKFYGQIPMDNARRCLLKIRMAHGENFLMSDSGFDSVNLTLYFKIGTTTLIPINFQSQRIIIDGNTGAVSPNMQFSAPSLGANPEEDDLDGLMFDLSNIKDISQPVEVSIHLNQDSQLSSDEYIKFTEISLNNPAKATSKYYEPYENKLTFNGNGIDEKSLTVNINNRFGILNDHSFGTNSGETASFNEPTFPYMFTPLTVLDVDMKRHPGSTTKDYQDYVYRWTYWINGWRWRMIGRSFNLVDDQYNMMLARSSVNVP